MLCNWTLCSCSRQRQRTIVHEHTWANQSSRNSRSTAAHSERKNRAPPRDVVVENAVSHCVPISSSASDHWTRHKASVFLQGHGHDAVERAGEPEENRVARQNHTALDVLQHHTLVHTGEVAGQHHEDEAAVHLDSVCALQVHLEVSTLQLLLQILRQTH